MKMMFATDVDGTILTDNNIPHPKTNDAFKYAKSKNNYIVIATGRALWRTTPLLTMMPDVDFFICNNGSLIYDVKKDKVLFIKGISAQHYIKTFNFAKQNNLFFAMHTNKKTYTWPTKRLEGHIMITDKINQQIIDFINSKNGKFMDDEIITQISFMADEEICNANLPLVEAMMKDINNVFLTNGIFIDINPLNTSKWTGLEFLAKYLELDIKNIVTFGDSGNDLEMLEKSGELGFPMANSTFDLLEKLPAKIGNNNSDAIAQKIIELSNK